MLSVPYHEILQQGMPGADRRDYCKVLVRRTKLGFALYNASWEGREQEVSMLVSLGAEVGYKAAEGPNLNYFPLFPAAVTMTSRRSFARCSRPVPSPTSKGGSIRGMLFTLCRRITSLGSLASSIWATMRE